MARTSTGAVALVAALALGLIGVHPASADTGTVTALAGVSGTVTDEQSGLPVADLHVDLRDVDDSRTHFAATTDADGLFTVHVPGGSYVATFEKLGAPGTDAYWQSYYPGTYDSLGASIITVTAGTDRTGLDIALPKAGGISGKVTLAGKPIKSGSVELRNDVTYLPLVKVTNGIYSGFPLPVGTYKVRVVADEDDPFLTTFLGNTVREPSARLITIGPGESFTNVDIAAKAGATIRGKVTDSKGKPVKSRWVWAHSLTRYGWVQALTDAKGVYVFHGLATGKVQITIDSTRYYNTIVASTTVQAVQGKTVSAKTLVPRRAGSATISGTVAITNGSRYGVQVALLDSKNKVVRSVTRPKGGKVTFKDLRAGRYTVAIEGANTARKVTVRSGKTASFGKLVRGKQSTLNGVVRRPDGKVAASGTVVLVDAYGTALREGYVTAKGTYSIKGLVRGRYTVRAVAGSGGHDVLFVGKTTFTVKAGAGVTKTLRLKPSGSITGVVKNAKGEPIVGVHVFIDPGFDLDSDDQWGHAYTDSNGVYVVKGITAGKHAMSFNDVYVGGYHNATKTTTVIAGKTVKAATIALK